MLSINDRVRSSGARKITCCTDNRSLSRKEFKGTAGLGTQATQANIIQILFQRKFIIAEKKLLKATQLGFDLIDAVPDTIKDPLLTAQWEQQLDDITNNKGQDINGFLQQQILLLNNIVTQVKTPQTKYQSVPVSSNSVTQANAHPPSQTIPGW